MEGETTIARLTLSRKEAAHYLGIHVNTLDRSDIPRIYIGGKVLFKIDTLKNFFTEVQRRRPRCKK